MSNFEIGDEVRITRKTGDHEHGWNNLWTEEMEKFINDGVDYVVTYVGHYGARLRRKDGGYSTIERFGWPPHGLTRLHDIGPDLFDVKEQT